MRLDLNTFFDNAITSFSAYDDTLDKPRWESTTPVGAVMRFDINVFPWAGAFSNFSDGSVICTAYVRNEYWRFSTLYTTGDSDHPVSGHREFGVHPHESGGHLVYTRAVDRVTDGVMEGMTLSGGHNLWVSFQQRIAGFVNSGSGSAHIQVPIRNLPTWEALRVRYSPTESWL